MLDARDVAFMQRLNNLGHEALTWPHLDERQRLVWAAALELDAVPLQESLHLPLHFDGYKHAEQKFASAEFSCL